ncbi:MAG TPA: pectate lyase [bacterium]|nr:pectate lyase [bacterium]
MKQAVATSICYFVLCCFLCISAISSPAQEDVLAAIKRATQYMMNTVSTRGGFLWNYSEDFSEQWGEIPARKSMIWVQRPGTVGAGEAFLRAYRITGDKEYLDYAERVANALIYGQFPSGGWNYFIDFDPAGTQQWYEDIAAKCWGWEEFYYNYENCTYDDYIMTDTTRFLIDLYLVTLNPKYRDPMLKALQFFLDSQYPNGAWPQRFPPPNESAPDRDSHYTLYYTFNDDVILGNIEFLLEAYERLGDKRYWEAAVRGMDFVMISQQGAPQSGWAQQYSLDLKPAPARSCEPAAVMPTETCADIMALQRYYQITGDRKYLRGIPDAIRWLENSILPPEKTFDGHTHALFYEIGTNRPLFVHRFGTSKETGRYVVDYDPTNLIRGYGTHVTINTEYYWNEYRRVESMTPEKARAEYTERKSKSASVPKVASDVLEKVLQSRNANGIWTEEFEIQNFDDYMNNPPRRVRGYSTATYLANMKVFMDFLENEKGIIEK